MILFLARVFWPAKTLVYVDHVLPCACGDHPCVLRVAMRMN